MIKSELMEANPKIDRDRLSVLLGAVAVGFVASKLVQLPSQQVGLSVLGSELGLQLTNHWLMVTLAVGLAVSGTRSLFRLHPQYRQEIAFTAVYWILPAVTTLTIGLLLARTAAISQWLLLMLFGIGLLHGVLSNEFRLIDRRHLGHAGMQISSRILAYLLGLTLFTLIYSSRARTLLLAPAILIVSSLLALRLFWNVEQAISRVLVYAGVTGLLMGQSVWAINYWQISSVTGGLYLLLIFYVSTGLVGQSMSGSLSGRILLEYAVLALLAAAAISSLQF